VVLVLIVLVSGCIAVNPGKVKIVNNTYSDDGVSFNVPANWEVSKIVSDSNTNIDINENNSSHGTQITVAISPNPTGMSNQDLIDSIQNPVNQDGSWDKISNGTINIDGNNAYENIYIFKDSNRFKQTMKEEQISFIKNGKTYTLIFDAPVQSFDRDKSYFNITINSFKIL
jgi:hypothetical protein